MDYQQVCAVVDAVGKARKYHLIETLSGAILDAILEGFPQIERVAIRLRKTSLPFDVHLDCVEVEMERGR